MIKHIIIAVSFLSTLAACKKEAALKPVSEEEYALIVKDNPSDPVDHAIYQFYQATSIPCFYNDTIARKEHGQYNGQPNYSYTRLMVSWSPVMGADTFTQFRLTPDKLTVLPMLNFLKNDILPLVPSQVPVRSILFTENIITYRALPAPDDSRTREVDAFAGFNTVVLKIIDPASIDAASKKVYVNNVLEALCFKKLANSPEYDIENKFFSISRLAWQGEIYITDFTFMYPDGDKKPEDFGLVYYYDYSGYYITCSYQEDLQAFLNLIFNNTTAALNSRYATYPLIIQKINVLRPIVQKAGFKIPD